MVIKKPDIGMSSRGDEAEKIRLVQDLLHQEQHLVETLVKEPTKAKELTKTIDNLRKQRQEVVNLWAGKKINPNFWCALKHNLESTRRIEELIENAVRVNPSQVSKLATIARNLNMEQKKIIDNFKSGKSRLSEECDRCFGDINSNSNPEIIISDNDNFNDEENDKTKSLNNLSSNINNEDSNNPRGEHKMANIMKELGPVNLAQLAGKGAVIVSKIVDKKLSSTIVMDKVYKKPSTYINIGGGIALQLLGVFGKMRSKQMKDFLIVMGSHMSAEAISVAIEATGVDIGLGPGVSRRLGVASRPAFRTSVRPSLMLSRPEFSPTQAGGAALF